MFHVSGFGSWVSDSGFRAWCSWFRDFVFRFQGLGFHVWGFYDSILSERASEFRVSSSRCGVSYFGTSGFGVRASGFGIQVLDFVSRIAGFGHRVSGFRFQVSGFGSQGWIFGFRNSEPREVEAVEGIWWRDLVSGFEFRVSGFGFRVSGFGFRVSVFVFRVSGFGFEVSGFGFRISSFGFRVSDLRFRVSGF